MSDEPDGDQLRAAAAILHCERYVAHGEAVDNAADEIERLRGALGVQVEKNRVLLNRVGNVTRSRQRWVRIAREHGYSGPGPSDPTGPDPVPSVPDADQDAHA